MKLINKKSTIKTLRFGDTDFIISDGVVTCPRAGFEVLKGCPDEYLRIIRECIHRGWLRPVAHIKEKDYIWEKLCD